MCGIVGCIDWQKDLTASPKIISAMTDTLTHRGPDAGGCWSSPSCALGHRRLAIIDPENGAQPMYRHRGEETYVIVYNGEIYNARELRVKLEQHGFVFYTQCDTEVLLCAYIKWGTACLNQLNGIYACAIWREKEQDLFLARDRLGVKPLFYSTGANQFTFASEPKAILAHPDFEPIVSYEGLAEIFAIGPARTPGHGIYQNMHELKPGHYLVYSQKGTALHAYWKLEAQDHADDESTTALTIKQLLTDSLHRQLRADVPLCTFLSGGLDSSLLSALASEQLQQSQKKLSTYSINYVNHDVDFQPDAFLPSYDEPWAQHTAQLLDTHHQTVHIQLTELIDALIPAMQARDMPGMADVDSSLYVFCQHVKPHSTVAISGEASDELFGGYPWFHLEHASQGTTFPWSTQLERRITTLHPELVASVKPAAYVRERYEQALAEVPHLAHETIEQKRRRDMSYLNITRFMPTLLDRKDRMSMAAGLEVRVPFCDHRLVEYAWNIPWKMKNANQHEKGILRQAFAGMLPNEILYRKKSPYPKTHNPLYAKAMMNWLREIIHDPSSPLLPLVHKQTVLNLIHTYEKSESFHWFGQLMTLPQLFAYFIQVNEWLRSYKITIKS